MIEAVLNRLRGTGVLKHFGTIRIGEYSIEVKLVWNHVYAMYLGVIAGVLGGWIAGVCVAIAYFVGESKGWGEWVGALVRWEDKDEQLQAQANAEAKEYLASTDWYVTRFTETGKEISEEVKTKRDEARLQIQ